MQIDKWGIIMRITTADMASMMIKKQQFQKQKGELGLSNGSAPSKGHVNPFEDPDLNITDRSPSEWQKIVPVDNEVAEKLKALIKEDFVKRNGMCGMGKQADMQANIIKSYAATLHGDQKLSAIYSCEQIAFQEADRLSSKIRKQNSDWQYGEPFDTSILEQNFDKKI